MRLSVEDLLDLVMHWILFHLAEPEISRVNRPIVRPLFLLPRIIILMRFQVQLSHFLTFRHIFPRVNGLLDPIFVLLSRYSISEFLALCVLG